MCIFHRGVRSCLIEKMEALTNTSIPDKYKVERRAVVPIRIRDPIVRIQVLWASIVSIVRIATSGRPAKARTSAQETAT